MGIRQVRTSRLNDTGTRVIEKVGGVFAAAFLFLFFLCIFVINDGFFSCLAGNFFSTLHVQFSFNAAIKKGPTGDEI